MTASLAGSAQNPTFVVHLQDRLRIIASLAEHKLSNEYVQHVLQFGRFVGTINDVSIVLVIKLGLSTELTTKEFGRI